MKSIRMMKKWTKQIVLALLTTMLLLNCAAAESTKGISELDGTKIERVKVMWLTPDSAEMANGQATPQAELDAKDHLYLSATSDMDIKMVYRITADFSGHYDYAPGDIVIRIPAQVWHAREYVQENGQSVGRVNEARYIGTLKLPLPKAPSTKADFNWQIINGEYVLTNTRTIGATSSVSIDVEICGFKATDVVDMSECEPITAHCEVVTHQGNTIEMSSSSINAQIDTIAQITDAHKNGEVYEDYPQKLDAELLKQLPAGTDKNDYVYVRWVSYPTVQASQPGLLKMKDVVSYAYENVSDGNGGTKKQKITDGIFLGSTNYMGDMPGADDSAFSAVIDSHSVTSGTLHAKAVVMWTAYRKSDFYVPLGSEPQRVYYFENTAVWTLTEADGSVEVNSYDKPADEQLTTAADKTVLTKYAPIRWGVPYGHFKVIKYTETNGQVDHVYGYALNHLENNNEAEMEFIVKTEGLGYPWTASQTSGHSYEDLKDPASSGVHNDSELKEDQFGLLGWKQISYDFQTMFNFDDKPLGAEDFEFKSLRVDKPIRYRYAKQQSGLWDYLVDATLPVPDLNIEYQVNNESEWLPAAVAVWGTDGLGTLQFKDVAANVRVSGSTLYFPENVTDFRHTFTSNVFNGKTAERCEVAGLNWTVYPKVVLKPSERILGIVRELFEENESPTTKFKNDVGMDVYGWVDKDGKGQLVLNNDFDTSRASLEGARYGASMASTSTYESDVENQQILLHYSSSVSEQSNLSERSDYDEAIKQGAVSAETSGIWYNLLPVNVAPLLDTIRLRDKDIITNAYTIENYKGTGRTLLVVEAELTPVPELIKNRGYSDQPTITFDAVYSWPDLKEQGENLICYSAFESTVNELPSDTLGSINGQMGEPDNPAGGKNSTTPAMPQEILYALKDLDPNTDENRFLYGKTADYVNVLAYTVSGLEKTVRSDLDGIWTQGLDEQEQATVYEGQTYTYRLRVSSAEDTSTKDIVIYDSIENYRLPDPSLEEDADATKAGDFEHAQERRNWTGDWENRGQWRGTLESVDLSGFVRAGAKPALLYSTQPNLQFAEDAEHENYDITNRALWQSAELSEDGLWHVPAGLNVTAVAIDLSKQPDGADFVLKPEQSLSGYLKMRAPDDHGSDESWNAKGAYARILDDQGNPVLDENGRQQIDWEAAMDPANNMYAYNNARVRLLQGRTSDTTGVTFWQDHHRLIRNDYTRVGIVPSILKLEKIWQDQDDHDAMRPQSITVSVLRRVAGMAGEAQQVLDADGNPLRVELNESNAWKVMFHQMPLTTANGQRYLYTFREEPVEGYECNVHFVNANQFRMINQHPNEQVALEGLKVWNDDGNAHAKRPESIVLKLYRDGTKIDEKIVKSDANGDWKYSFGKLDKYARGGQEYVYTIEEEYVPKYAAEADGYTQVNNTYDPVGELEVSKKLLNATPKAADKAFTFTLVLLAEPVDNNTLSEPLLDKYPYFICEPDGDAWKQVSSGEIGNGGTFQLKQNQKIVIAGIPSESRYQIIETEEDGFISTAENAEGMILAGRTVSVLFINEYCPVGTAQLVVDKKLTGQAIRKNQFRFELVDMNEDSETYGQVIRSARVQAPEAEATTGGCGEKEIESLTEAFFGQLEYGYQDDGKEFHYQVREVDAGRPGYTSDKNVYDVTVKVEDNGDGTMTVTPEYKGKLGVSSELKFENKYEANGELTLKVWKTLEGRKLKDGEFTFELYRHDADNTGWGELISTAVNDTEGTVAFDELKFNQNHLSTDSAKPAQYTYLIRERTGDDSTVEYSNLEYMFTVTVLDNGDGTLSFEQGKPVQYVRTYADCTVCEATGKIESDTCNNCKGEGIVPGTREAGEESVMPVFVNRLKPGALSVAKQVSLNNPKNPNQSFTFHVKLSTQLEQLDYRISGATPTPVPTATPTPAPTPTPSPKPAGTPSPTPVALEGQAYSAQMVDSSHPDNGKLILFRSSATEPVDPWGNKFDMEGQSRVVSSNGKIVWCRLDESAATTSGNNPNNRLWAQKNNFLSVKAIEVRDPIRFKSGYKLFYNFTFVKSIDTRLLDTSEMVSMAYMFDWCRSLKTIDFSTFNTSKVTDMSAMFIDAVRLENIDLSSFDTSNVTNMSYMFCNAGSETGGRWDETTIDVSSFDTSKVTNMERMFAGVDGLRNLDLSNFDTSNVTKMNGMFDNCTYLKSVDLSSFITSKVTDMNNMFHAASTLKTLDLSHFDTRQVTNMSNMFAACNALETLDISSFDTSNVTKMSDMFSGCQVLQTISIGDDTRLSAYPPGHPNNWYYSNYDENWRNKKTNEILKPEALFPEGNNEGTWTWNMPCYKLNFDPGEGSGSMPSMRIAYKSSYTFTPTFYRYGYELTGFVDDNGKSFSCVDGKVSIPSGTYSLNKEATLTAQWALRPVTLSESKDTITFTLKKGEVFTLDNLPAGTVYEVREEMPYHWFLNSKTGDIGAIQPQQASKAEFTNEYNTSKASVPLSAIKLLDGKRAAAGEFTFTLSDQNGNVIQTVKNTAGGGVVFDPIVLTDFDYYNYYTYYIEEVPDPNNQAIEYDTEKYAVQIFIRYGRQPEIDETAAAVEVTYYDSQGNTVSGIPVFHNTTKPGALTIRKSIQGSLSENAQKQEFRFALTFSDEQFQPWSGSLAVGDETLTVTNGEAQLKLGGGKSVTVTGIPAGLKYEVREELPEGWKQVSANGDTGKISGGATSTAEFVNEYSLSGSASISITKELIGRALEKDEFTFQLLDEAENVITATNGADGTVLFDRITYSEEGTHTYKVYEVPGADDDPIEYSDAVLTVTVTMSDKDGKGVLTPSFEWEDGKQTITNSVKPGSLEISKQVVSANEAHHEKAFGFVISLTDPDGQPLSGSYELSDGSMLSVENGMARIELQHGQTETIHGLPDGTGYTVTEEETPGFSAEATGASGKITAAQIAQALFTNTYSAYGEYVLKVEKTLTGRDLIEGEFIFALQDADGRDLETVSVNAQGTARFTELRFTEKDVGHSRTYFVREKNNRLPGVTYDSAVHEINLTATDNGDGTLTVADDLAGEPVKFVNTYSEKTSVCVEKRWQDEDDLFGIRPENIVVELYRNGEKQTEQTLNEAKGWKHTFEDLDVFDEQMQAYTWQVREVPVNGYDSMKSIQDGKTVITNTVQGVLDVTKTVVAGDTEKEFTFTVTLAKNGAAVSSPVTIVSGESVQTLQPDEYGSVSFTLSHGETARLYGLPAGAAYTVTENAEPNYTVVAEGAEGVIQRYTPHHATFVNEYEAEGELILEARKIMRGRELAEGEFTFALMDENGELLQTVSNDAAGRIVFESIRYRHGKESSDIGEHIYTVKEQLPEAKDRHGNILYDERFCVITVTVTDNGDGTLKAEKALSQSGAPVEEIIFENVWRTLDFKVTKEWYGGSGPIKLTLFANGEKLDPQPECVRDGDLYTFPGLPVCDENGETIVYSAKERYVDGFIAIYVNPAPFQKETKSVYNGGVIINKLDTPEEVDFSVKKVWKGLGEGEEPPTIKLVLYCNGEAMNVKTPAPDRNGWYCYTNLPEEVNGKPAVYTVKEERMEGCETSYRLSDGTEADYADNGGVITNTRIPKTGDRTPLALLACLMSLSAAVMLAVLKRRKA